MSHEDSDPIEDDHRVFQVDAQQLTALRDSADAHDFEEFMRVYHIIGERNAEIERQRRLEAQLEDKEAEEYTAQALDYKAHLAVVVEELGTTARENNELRHALIKEVLARHETDRRCADLEWRLKDLQRRATQPE